MSRNNVPLRPQKQIDQAIKNFILDKSHTKSSLVCLSFGGNTNIKLQISDRGVRASRLHKGKSIFLGNYYSEDLVTDPELINYEMPKDPYFTYDEILQRGEEVKKYGRVISDDKQSVSNVYTKGYPMQPPSINLDKLFGFKLLSDSVKETLNEQRAKVKSIDAAYLDEEVTFDDDEKTKEKESLKESLKRRLRLLDLKIEREEILNYLAAL